MESLELMPARIKITSILRKAILSGEFQGGQELSLTGTAEKLGVSRTPVREAFQTLSIEGMLELRMNKGAIVKPIDEKFIRDHYEMRIVLECEAVELAVRHDMDVSELLVRLYHLRDNLNVVERYEYTELNQQLHTAIWEAADNQKLFGFLSGLWNGPSIGRSNSEQEHFRKSTEEHIDLLLAIRRKEVQTGRAIMKQHISRSMENILTSFRTEKNK